MDGRGGCCIARYPGGGGGSGFGEISYGMSKVERIMLKFRPIAPKPIAAGSGSSCSTVEHSEGYGGTRRRKRKYVRVNGSKTKKQRSTVSKKRKLSESSSENSSGRDPVVTLSLMPETPDQKEKPQATSSSSENLDLLYSVPKFNPDKPSPILLSFSNHQQTNCDNHVRGAADHVVSATDRVVAIASPSPSPPLPPQKLQVFSFVTMECVTDTWVNGDWLGFTDQAGVMNTEMDSCPSFITNTRDTVVWTNKAYREMTAGGGSDETAVVKKFNRVTMPVSHPAFTCKVKVTWGTDRATSPSTITAPCDVWRLRSGGYAWRLDVKAALSLGR